MHLLKMYQIVL